MPTEYEINNNMSVNLLSRNLFQEVEGFEAEGAPRAEEGVKGGNEEGGGGDIQGGRILSPGTSSENLF